MSAESHDVFLGCIFLFLAGLFFVGFPGSVKRYYDTHTSVFGQHPRYSEEGIRLFGAALIVCGIGVAVLISRMSQ